MTKRILVVDDEKCISDSLTAILNNCGFVASAFYDAKSALAECEATKPELVISDVVMPGMTGIEMAIVIKKRHPSCKILLFSGQAATADMLVEARERGYDFELLVKPIHPKDLLAKLSGLESPLPPASTGSERLSRTA